MRTTHLIGPVLYLPRDLLHRVASVAALGLDGEFVVAPRGADRHVHLQSRALDYVRKHTAVPLGVVFGRVDRRGRDLFPGVILHARGVRRDAVFQWQAAVVRDLPSGGEGYTR